MSEVKQRGRRRASSPAFHGPRPTPGSSFHAGPHPVPPAHGVSAHGSRREALAVERAQAPSGISVAQLLRAGASSGAGQRVGVAMAATGLVMAVSLQGTQAAENVPLASSAASVVDAVVTAGADVPIAFATPEVASALNPDGQLKETLKVNASNVTPQASKGTLSAPLKNMVTSSPFGYRVSPITGQLDEQHTGQDFAIQCGNEVLAAAGGVVTFSGWHDFGGGNRVVVDHGNGLSTSYNHMSKNSVTVGQKVERGDLVGLSGTTGASTGCHLHFEVIVDDETVDPVDWL